MPMPLVQRNIVPVINTSVHIHYETTNQSFLNMHYYLRDRGIKNNAFFLYLFDTGLIGVDPRDPTLSTSMKARVLRECCCNYFYFLREVVRIPDEGGSAANGKRYELHRGNLAMNYLFTLNYNMFVELPRQFGKTTAALIRYLWVFNFGTTNSEIMFIHRNHDMSKQNLAFLKHYREALPSYLQMDSIINIEGKKLKTINRTETIENAVNHNRIVTLPSAKSKQLANSLGRGCRQPLQYYDEFGWLLYNQLIYESATPAFRTSANNAKMNGAPYGICLTTTPGLLTTEEGKYAFYVRNNATKWVDDFYDKSYEQMEGIRLANENSNFFHIKFTYQQLGRGSDYLEEQVRDLQKNYTAIRREVLLEWAQVAENCPFTKEDLDIVNQYCHDPIRQLSFGQYGEYQLQIYKDMDLRHSQIIGVDVAGGMRRDSSALTIIDAKTTEVVAAFNCNYISIPDFYKLILELVTKYLPHALVVVEKNGIGHGLIQLLMKSPIKKNLYYTIEDRTLSERTNGVTIVRSNSKVKAYGLDNSGSIRQRLMDIMFVRMQYHKAKFICPILHDEMSGLTYRVSRVNGDSRIDHSVNTHDDQLFSYLLALYVWYDCADLGTRFGITRGEIRTDDDNEEGYGSIESLVDSTYEELDMDEEDEFDNPILEPTKEVLKDMKKPLVTITDLEKMQYYEDQEALTAILSTPNGIKAVENAYGVNMSEEAKYSMINGIGATTITQDVFDSFYMDEEEMIMNKKKKLNGNLYGIYQNINE